MMTLGRVDGVKKRPGLRYLFLFVALVTLLSPTFAWYYTGWQYRAPITIAEQSGTTLTDYQKKIVIDTTSLISAGKMNADCSDMRFTYFDGTTETNIPYWIEKGCNTANTVIWVKVPSIPASGTATVYMYYGNPTATSESNSEAVFIFYEDFEDGVARGASADGSTWTVTDADGDGDLELKNTNTSGGGYNWNFQVDIAEDVIIDFCAAVTNTASGSHLYLHVPNSTSGDPSTGSGYVFGIAYNEEHIYKMVSGSGSKVSYSATTIGTSVEHCLVAVIDVPLIQMTGNTSLSYNDPSPFSYPFTLMTWVGYGSWLDNIRVRKYASVEPTYTIGAEETSDMPVIELVNRVPHNFSGTIFGVSKTSSGICLAGKTSGPTSLAKLFSFDGTQLSTFQLDIAVSTNDEAFVGCTDDYYAYYYYYNGSPRGGLHDGTNYVSERQNVLGIDVARLDNGDTLVLFGDGLYKYSAGSWVQVSSYQPFSSVDFPELWTDGINWCYGTSDEAVVCNGVLYTIQSTTNANPVWRVAANGDLTVMYAFMQDYGTNTRKIFEYRNGGWSLYAEYPGTSVIDIEYVGGLFFIVVRDGATDIVSIRVLDEVGNVVSVTAYQAQFSGGAAISYLDVEVVSPRANEYLIYFADGSYLYILRLSLAGIAASLTHTPTAQSDLALDPENNVNEVNVEYNAVFNKNNVTITYYRAFDGDTNTTIVEGNQDVNYVVFSRTYTAVGDYNTCVYVVAVDDTNTVYEDTTCDVVHIDMYPQNLNVVVNQPVPFRGEVFTITASATDNGTLTYDFDVTEGPTPTTLTSNDTTFTGSYGVQLDFNITATTYSGIILTSLTARYDNTTSFVGNATFFVEVNDLASGRVCAYKEQPISIPATSTYVPVTVSLTIQDYNCIPDGGMTIRYGHRSASISDLRLRYDPNNNRPLEVKYEEFNTYVVGVLQNEANILSMDTEAVILLSVVDDVNLSKGTTYVQNIYRVPVVEINRRNLEFYAAIRHDDRLELNVSEWNINGRSYSGSSVSVGLTTRYPTGTYRALLVSTDGNREINGPLPELNVDYTYTKGFTRDITLDVNFSIDKFAYTPKCRVTINGTDAIRASPTEWYRQLKDGSNEIVVECKTVRERYRTQDTFEVYTKRLVFVDETTLNPVDLNTLITLATYDNNGNSYDLKAQGVTDVYYIAEDRTTVVAEFVYAADASRTTLFRLFSVDITPSETKVCIPEFQLFNEVILYSSKVMPVWVTNSTSGCYITAAYTEQLYGDARAVSVLLVPKLYNVSVYNENGERVILGTVYGSRAQTINLDLLVYRLRRYQASILPVTYAIEKENANELRIFIKNPAFDARTTTLKIYRSNGDVVFTHVETISPNDFQVIFNHATLDINEDEILRLEVIIEREDGSTRTETAFFKITGEVGILEPLMGIVSSLLVALVSLTAVSAKTALGPFGMLGLLVALAITAVTVRTVEVVFIQVLLVVALAYIFLSGKNNSGGGVI